MSKKKSKIPEGARLVFKGQIFEVWQWEQKMFDGTTETFEILRRPNTAEVICVVGDKILTIEEEQPNKTPFPALPGGRCGWDEDPLIAAKRELLEETGYVSDSWELWKEQVPVGKMEWTIYTYIARNCVKQQEPHLDAGEKITPKLISLDEFIELSENPKFYEGELSKTLLRAKFDPVIKKEFQKLLFGKT